MEQFQPAESQIQRCSLFDTGFASSFHISHKIPRLPLQHNLLILTHTAARKQKELFLLSHPHQIFIYRTSQERRTWKTVLTAA